MIKWDKPCYKCLSHFCDLSCKEPEHLKLPQRTWVGLTDEEIYSVLENLQVMYNRPPTTDSRIIFAKALLARVKEKNT
mgnify:CR=1 FL=1|tara:strand:+ start:585 stop:818 length:234 start_codon:yes stop_codon:yes gene_type:complete